MRRGAARLALAALAVAALAAACAPPKKAPPPPEEIVFWAPWPGEIMGPVIAAFERDHPGLRVRVESMPDSARARRIARAQGSLLPDLCAVGTEDMPTLLAGGRLADWSAGAADLRPALLGWESCSVGEAIYGIPWLLAPRALFCNRALFARAGLDPGALPRTWSDLERAAARIERLGHGVSGFGIPAPGPESDAALVDGLLPFIASAGGSVLSEDRRRAVLDSAGNVRALELLARLRRFARVAAPAALESEFRSGTIGMIVAGPGLLRGHAAGALDLAVVALPRPEADSVARSWATGQVLVSFNGSRHRHEALVLARALADPAAAGALSLQVTGYLPAATGADTSVAYRDRANELRMLAQRADCRYAPAHPAWGAIKDSLAGEVEAALRGRKPAERAIADAQAQLEEILRR